MFQSNPVEKKQRSRCRLGKEQSLSKSPGSVCVSVLDDHALKSGFPEVGWVSLPSKNTNGCSFVLSRWNWNINTLFLCWLVVLLKLVTAFLFTQVWQQKLNHIGGLTFNTYSSNSEVQHYPSEYSLKENWKPITIFTETSLSQRNKELGVVGNSSSPSSCLWANTKAGPWLIRSPVCVINLLANILAT